jgi:hypothetical protein
LVSVIVECSFVGASAETRIEGAGTSGNIVGGWMENGNQDQEKENRDSQVLRRWFRYLGER